MLWTRIRINLALLDPDWAVLRIIRDPVLFGPLDPGWKKSRFGINIPDHIYESLVRIFWFKNIELFVANPDLVSGIEKSGSGIKSRDKIPEPQQ